MLRSVIFSSKMKSISFYIKTAVVLYSVKTKYLRSKQSRFIIFNCHGSASVVSYKNYVIIFLSHTSYISVIIFTSVSIKCALFCNCFWCQNQLFSQLSVMNNLIYENVQEYLISTMFCDYFV